MKINSTKNLSYEDSKAKDLVKQGAKKLVLFTLDAIILQSMRLKFLKFLPYIFLLV